MAKRYLRTAEDAKRARAEQRCPPANFRCSGEGIELITNRNAVSVRFLDSSSHGGGENLVPADEQKAK